MNIKLDMMQTTALAVAVYYFGAWLKTKWTMLERFCIPAPVVGGLVFAIVNLILNQTNALHLTLDTTLQKPFMMVFFTSIGMGASIELIKKGGLQVIIFWLCACTLCICQDVVGVTLAKILGKSPLLGLLCGSITMTGGHGTGAAFGPLFEKSYGVVGATTTAMASATFGLVMGSIIGGPVGKRLIDKKNLKSPGNSPEAAETVAATTVIDEKINYEELFKTLGIILISIGVGAVLEKFFVSLGITLPSYVNSMIIAAILLNVGESTGKWHVNQKCTDVLGNIGLNVFLSMALVGLKLWELAAVAGPMLIILVAQTTLMALFATFITYNFLGKDYDAAVMAAGHCGLGLGAGPNALANERAVMEEYGYSELGWLLFPALALVVDDIFNPLVISGIMSLYK